MLAGGSTVKHVSVELKVGQRTVYDWIDDPKYKLLIARFRRRMLDRAVGLMTEATTKAVMTLRKLLDSEDEPIRLRAASSLLDHSIRLREQCEFNERLAALEAPDDGGDEEPAFQTGGVREAVPGPNGRA